LTGITAAPRFPEARLYDFERRALLPVAKIKGVKFGRKPSLTPHQQREARKRLEAGETQRRVARSYNVSQSTISRLTA
jgi:DNA invertase Pin-like site-specific DNA recombinase